MSFFSEYRKSLKMIETEEVFDLLIFRPLGFLIMKIFYRTNVTPNFLTGIALIFGVAAGILFTQNQKYLLIIGCSILAVSNAFDCADGQLARAKKNGTRFGRIFDGIIDYIVYIFIYVGMALHLFLNAMKGAQYLWPLQDMYYMWWVFVALAGASTSIQALVFDGVRNDFHNYTVGNNNSTMMKEYEEYQAGYEALRNQKGHLREKFLYKVYLSYLSVQIKSSASVNSSVDSDLYYRNNRIIIRLWGFVGSTTHLVFLIGCGIFGRFDIYVWGVILPLNLFTFVLWLFQKRINKKTIRKT